MKSAKSSLSARPGSDNYRRGGRARSVHTDGAFVRVKGMEQGRGRNREKEIEKRGERQGMDEERRREEEGASPGRS